MNLNCDPVGVANGAITGIDFAPTITRHHRRLALKKVSHFAVAINAASPSLCWAHAVNDAGLSGLVLKSPAELQKKSGVPLGIRASGDAYSHEQLLQGTAKSNVIANLMALDV